MWSQHKVEKRGSRKKSDRGFFAPRPSSLAPCFFLLLLAACGFHSMYGDDSMGNSNTALRGNVAIDKIIGREGQILKTALEDKFNPEGLDTTNAEYHLSVVLTKSISPSVVKSDGTIQRYDARFDSTFKLFKAGNNTPVFAGTLRRIGSYNTAVNANFATYEAEQDTIERTLQDMAEDYVFRISGFLMGAEKNAKPAPAASPVPYSSPLPPPIIHPYTP